MVGDDRPRRHDTEGPSTDDKWWRQTLTNPKYADFQHPTVWPGFKPTKEERRKAREEALSQLVPCVLPALWDLETYNRILATLKARWHGPKVRTTYQEYLLSANRWIGGEQAWVLLGVVATAHGRSLLASAGPPQLGRTPGAS